MFAPPPAWAGGLGGWEVCPALLARVCVKEAPLWQKIFVILKSEMKTGGEGRRAGTRSPADGCEPGWGGKPPPRQCARYSAHSYNRRRALASRAGRIAPTDNKLGKHSIGEPA